MKHPVIITIAIAALFGACSVSNSIKMTQLLVIGLGLGIFFGTICLKKKPAEETRESRI